MTAESKAEAGLRSHLARVPFALLLVTGVSLYFLRLDAQSFWLDELWTAAASDPALPFRRWMAEWVLPDVHPPLYMVLVRAWRAAFGDSEFTLRLLSAVLSLGLAASVPLLQRWMPVVRHPLPLAAWFACAPGVVLYAQEARPYALLLLLTTVATLLGVTIAARMDRGEPVLRPLLALAAVVVVAEYTHYFGALVGAGLFGALLVFAGFRHRRHLRTVALAGMGAGGLLLPWLVLHVQHVTHRLGGNFWVTNNWLRSFPEAAGLAAGTPEIFLLIAAAVAALLALRPSLLPRPGCCIPLLAMVLMPLGALAISLHTPIITARNLLILLPPFYLLTVTAVTDFFEGGDRPSGIGGRLVLLLVVLTSFGFAVHRLAVQEKDQWREAAAQVVSLPGCHDAELQVHYWPAEIYAYYLPSSYRQNLRSVSVVPHDPGEGRPIARPAAPCPLIVWSGHMIGEALLQRILERLAIDREDVILLTTKGNMVVVDKNLLLAASRAAPQRDGEERSAAPSAGAIGVAHATIGRLRRLPIDEFRRTTPREHAGTTRYGYGPPGSR